ncbi:MAG: LarC family nickel insertion protein, partial [Rhodobacteraceae bacterium]|nr:LarC family nickel insertion protein [Paracoccaceae bacterium]
MRVRDQAYAEFVPNRGAGGGVVGVTTVAAMIEPTVSAAAAPLPLAAIHLDAVGGVSGDMFVAALLDARPDLIPICLQSVEAARRATQAPAGAAAQMAPHSDGVLTGTRFVVTPDEMATTAQGHGHRHWTALRGEISRAEELS